MHGENQKNDKCHFEMVLRAKNEDQEQKGSLRHIYIPCCFCQDRLRLGIELGMRTIWPDVEISEKCVCVCR